MNEKKAVVLFSGGLDSTTCLAIAIKEGFEVYALTINYNQKQNVEIERAKNIAQQLKVKEHIIFDCPLNLICKSALTSKGIEVPKNRIILNGGIPITYVPSRNIIFLSLALGYAESIGAYDIYIGVNIIDWSGYPDCRPEFIQAFEKMANVGTKVGVEGRTFKIHTPLINLKKAEIIKLGYSLGVDYSLTHSCYDPLPDGTACGRCDACILRRRAFKEAGLVDPIKYAE